MKTIKLLSILSLSILMFSCENSSNTSNGSVSIQHSNVEEFAKIIETGEGFLLDVRTPNEYQQGHIEGATLINIYDSDFEEKIDKLDKSKPVYVYCKSGGRSMKAAKIMKEKGFKEIINLDGGYSAWSH